MMQRVTTPRSADRAELSFYVEKALEAARCASALQGKPADVSCVEVYRPTDMEQFKKFWSQASGAGAANAQAILKQLEDRGSRWRCSERPSDLALCALKKRFPNFEEPVQDVRRAVALAALTGSPTEIPPLLLGGPPGIGKSRFARELATVLAVPLLTYSMTQTTASFSLAGLNTQYDGGGPGDLVRSIASIGSPDLVVVVDEIDKAPAHSTHDPTGPLHELLERATASRYVDDGLRMPLNLGALRWVCTCNDVDQITEPIRSRLTYYDIQPPTRDQMRQIAASTYREVVAANALAAHFDLEMPADVCNELSTSVPRDLVRVIRACLGSAALEGRSSISVADLPAERREMRTRIGFI